MTCVRGAHPSPPMVRSPTPAHVCCGLQPWPTTLAVCCGLQPHPSAVPRLQPMLPWNGAGSRPRPVGRGPHLPRPTHPWPPRPPGQLLVEPAVVNCSGWVVEEEAGALS
ncbi:hypothetical protein E2C01_004502 [Portunus trituberculatus]|uniref:Uncharacterized protein n=1 Tax=Portunus trituberculatus TaxID=210409 RepID=A0A5B7CPX8_PORTR|nr:hypothetical protein [Portunus trituberculatus]